MTVVAQASNGEEAVEQFLQHRPDVTLMDLQLPRMSGLQAIRAIRHAAARARIIVLTMYHGDEDIYRALAGRRRRLPPEGHGARRSDPGDSRGARRAARRFRRRSRRALARARSSPR